MPAAYKICALTHMREEMRETDRHTETERGVGGGDRGTETIGKKGRKQDCWSTCVCMSMCVFN